MSVRINQNYDDEYFVFCFLFLFLRIQFVKFRRICFDFVPFRLVNNQQNKLVRLKVVTNLNNDSSFQKKKNHFDKDGDTKTKSIFKEMIIE